MNRATLHLVLLLLPAAVGVAAPVATGREPIYLGSQACGKCHDGPAMGQQFSKWRLTAHARAYAALARPEAPEITLLSGITEAPHQAPLCLGCHATAADTEAWERTPQFHLEDGLQCEACHGPGSEYATEEIMRDRERAMAHGLRTYTMDDCFICHRPKGSHDAVLKREPFNVDKAWAAIAHPRPGGHPPEHPAAAPTPTASQAETNAPAAAQPFRFTGVMACAECHRAAESGFQFSRWRESKHAGAYARLATLQARKIAQAEGVLGDPQQAAACLKCHATGAGYPPSAFLDGFDYRDGVQCEACHGPGSDYSPEPVMRDPAAAQAKGLWTVDANRCLACHENAHGKPFIYEAALKQIAHPTQPAAPADHPSAAGYKNPLNLAFTPDGSELWVTCEASASVIILDPAARRKVAEITVGGQPTDLSFTPDGRRAFVSNRLDDTVSVIDVAARTVLATLPVGDEPHGVLVDPAGARLYVLNTSIDSISVFDLATLQEQMRLTASRSPWALALSPDRSQILVTHALSRFVPERTPSLSEITVIDAQRAMVEDRRVAAGANLMQSVAWHPGGEFAVAPLMRTKNLVPMTRLLQGWTISNGLGILWRDGTIDQVLLDQTHLAFPDPTGVAVTRDGKYALVTSATSDRVAVVDLDKLLALLRQASPRERQRVIPNHLGKPVEFVHTYIPTQTSPRGIVCAPDGATAWVAATLDDAVNVIDLNTWQVTARIDLGGTQELSQARRGEKLFHSANITFRRQFSCHSCHPDGHIDGLVYDIEADGIGLGPVDNRTLRGINDMAPYKWEGTNPSLKRQCGPRLAVFFTRIQPFTPEELADLDYYICTIPRPPNRYRKLGQDLTEAQRRGKAMFERTRTNDGRVIPVANRCTTCHPSPLFTDGRVHDVGTRFPNDHTGRFDAPHLHNIYDSAPYLHNGVAPTLEEIWTKYNPYDEHGVTNDLTKDQLNDLIEYLKTL